MICQICIRRFESYKALGIHIKRTHKISTKQYYDRYLKMESEGICLMYEKLESCKKYTKFENMRIGYTKYCSNNCALRSPIVQEKRCQTYFERTGYTNPSFNPDVIITREQTNIKKRNVKCPFQDSEVKRKIVETNTERRGYSHHSKDPKHQEEMRKRNMINYGCYYTFQRDDVKEKIVATNVRKRGVCNPSQDPTIQEKKIKTNLSKTGFCYPAQHPKLRRRLHETQRKKFLSRFPDLMKKMNLHLVDQEYVNEKTLHTWRCTKCGYEFKQIWNLVQQGYKCPKCYPRNQGQSKDEIKLGDWIESLGFDIIRRDKITIGRELDIYISKLKIGIEYDGVYWHSEECQERFYPNSNEDPKTKQLIKTELCTKNGIQLIHIFEDDWMVNQDQIKQLLRKILIDRYDLIDNDCNMIILDRRFSKNPKYYQKLGYEVNIIEPKLYHNKRKYRIWNVGYLELKRK